MGGPPRTCLTPSRSLSSDSSTGRARASNLSKQRPRNGSLDGLLGTAIASPTSSPSHWAFGMKDRKSTRLNSSHGYISYAVFCLKKKKTLLDSCLLIDIP